MRFKRYEYICEKEIRITLALVVVAIIMIRVRFSGSGWLMWALGDDDGDIPPHNVLHRHAGRRDRIHPLVRTDLRKLCTRGNINLGPIHIPKHFTLGLLQL